MHDIAAPDHRQEYIAFAPEYLKAPGLSSPVCDTANYELQLEPDRATATGQLLAIEVLMSTEILVQKLAHSVEGQLKRVLLR